VDHDDGQDMIERGREMAERAEYLDEKANLEEEEYPNDETVERHLRAVRAWADEDTHNPFCGVILAGGKGTRMGELTKVTNKHLLPVGNVPMVYHPLYKLVGAGIKDIMLVTGTEHMGDFVELLGSGKQHGCRLTYRVQDEAGGIAQALALAEWFCNGNKRPVVVLGDNIFQDSLHEILAQARKSTNKALIVLKEVPDPQRYGVVELFDKPISCPDHKPYCMVRHSCKAIRSIEEKPAHPKGNHAVTGIYVFPNDVFNVIRTLRPSARGELEVTDVNKYYLKHGRLNFSRLDGYWTDAGTLPAWRAANQMVVDSPPDYDNTENECEV
jgi:glucose-1-phosphate thymidylyltransferase